MNLTHLPRTTKLGGASRLFLYGRFSGIRQEKGDSFERQMDFARRWADQHGHIIDDSLTMFDRGLSAYKGDHVKRGALGAFLKAIREKGLVNPGDVLLVESLDRLSRAEPFEAQRQFGEIIEAGVIIVTANDGQVYSRERLKRDQSPLFLALAQMIRAYEESATKSKRVRSAVRHQCEQWEAGTWRGRLNVGRDPSWVRYDKKLGTFELDPQQAASMRALIDLYREGNGPTTAFEIMRAKGVPLPNGVPASNRLHVVMKYRCLVGEKIVTVEGDDATGIETKTFALKGYYPPLMNEAEFASLQYLIGQRGRRSGKSSVVGVITGMRLTYCAHCGCAMPGQNMNPRLRTARRRPSAAERRIVCNGRYRSDGKCDVGTCSIRPIEHALMKFCSHQMNLTALFADNDEQNRKIGAALALARQAVTDTEQTAQIFIAAAREGGTTTPRMILEEVTKLNRQLENDRRKVSDFERELESLNRNTKPAVASVWAELSEGVDALDATARTKVRQLVIDTFTRIEVSFAAKDRIGLSFVSKRNVRVILWIDRKTGEALCEPHFEPVMLDDEGNPALAWTPFDERKAAWTSGVFPLLKTP